LLQQFRHQLEQSLSKNGALSRANTELRHKVTELELSVKDQKDKISQLKNQVDHLGRIRSKQEQSLTSMQVRAAIFILPDGNTCLFFIRISLKDSPISNEPKMNT
jgi:DNA repair exonuclease SbcCD ATPase subunit